MIGRISGTLADKQPPQVLVIGGLGHCGVALAELASHLGYLVFGHDDRSDALSSSPSCECFSSWAALLKRVQGQTKPHVVLLTRNNALDVDALRNLYAWGAARDGAVDWVSAFGYLGMMGSQRRIRAARRRNSQV